MKVCLFESAFTRKVSCSCDAQNDGSGSNPSVNPRQKQHDEIDVCMLSTCVHCNRTVVVTDQNIHACWFKLIFHRTTNTVPTINVIDPPTSLFSHTAQYIESTDCARQETSDRDRMSGANGQSQRYSVMQLQFKCCQSSMPMPMHVNM